VSRTLFVVMAGSIVVVPGRSIQAAAPATRGEAMSKIEASIDVDVPVRVAYDQWTQFEEFPRFMDAVESVTQLDDTHLHWVAKIAGVRKEWDAKITQQEPGPQSAWTSTNGADNAGAVDFHRVDDRRT